MKRSPAIFYSVFLVTGAATVLLGILLAHASQAAAGDVRVGRLLAAQFCGQIMGSLLLSRRAIRSLASGLMVLVLAGAAAAWMQRPILALLFVIGIGLGCVMASVNIAAAQEVESTRRGSLLELLNVFWPIGAALCAPAVTVLGRYANPWRMYGVLALLFFVCLLWLGVTRPEHGFEAQSETGALRRIPWMTLALLCLTSILVVGVETGTASWLPAFSARGGMSAGMIAAVTACFWCGSLLSRLTAAYLLKRMPLHRMCLVAAAGSVAAGALLPSAAQPIALCAMALCAAVCVAPLYPALVTDCVDLRYNGLIFMSAGLGSALVPWSIGSVSTHTGPLHLAMLVPAACAAMMMLTMWLAGMFTRQTNLPAGAPSAGA